MTDTHPRLLGDSEIERIFEEVRGEVLQGESQDQPRLLIFGGPQGSRKTTMMPIVADSLGFRDAVKIDGDDLYSYHPRFDALAREHGALEAFRSCGKDVAVLGDMVLDHVREQRQDLVLVGPYTHQDLTFKRIEQFREAGYETEMAYTALHTARSQLGVMHRYHQAMEPGGPGYSILPSVALQEEVYSGVPDIMTEAHRRGVVKAVHAVDVDAGVIAFSRERDEVRETDPTIRERLENIRSRPWVPDIRDDFQRRRAEVERINGDEWPERLASVDRHAAPMLEASHTHQVIQEAPQQQTQRAIPHAVVESTDRTPMGQAAKSGKSEREEDGAPGDGRSAGVQRSLDQLRSRIDSRGPLPSVGGAPGAATSPDRGKPAGRQSNEPAQQRDEERRQGRDSKHRDQGQER